MPHAARRPWSWLIFDVRQKDMNRFCSIRFLTYVLLIAIATEAGRKRQSIEVLLEPQPFVPSSELSEWSGKSEPWLNQKLADAVLWRDDAKRIPLRDVDSGVRAMLKKERPGYRGLVRRMQWARDLGGWRSRHFEVYLVESDTGWVVLAARTWEVQMTG